MSGKLPRVIRSTDGAVLRTRAEARDYMSNLPAARARYPTVSDWEAVTDKWLFEGLAELLEEQRQKKRPQ